jgi:16S rRNA processing protein RimM
MGGDDLLPVGRVVGIHGTKGYLKLFPYADSPELLAPGQALVFRRGGESVGIFSVRAARPHKEIVLLQLEGIKGNEAARGWIGCEIFIDQASLPEPEEGSFYWYEIIGVEVFTLNGRRLGRVEAIIETGSNDVYVVRDGEKEILVPAIDTVVTEIDSGKGVMRVDLPEGLED